jgi:hypothetical protein
MAIWLSSRRTSPVVFAGMHDNRAPHTGAGSGGGRSPSISRKISWNNSFGTATSAIWNVT